MKTLFTFLLCLLTFVGMSQKTAKVVKIQSITWIEYRQELVTVPNHKPVGAVVGGTAGWLLLGGPVGIIGGALVGAAASDGTHQIIQKVPYRISGWYMTLSNGTIFRTKRLYKMYTVFNLDNLPND